MSEESFEPRDITVDGPASANEPRKSEEDPFQSKEKTLKRISIGKTILSPSPSEPETSHESVHIDSTLLPPSTATEQPILSVEEEKHIEEQAEAQLQDEVRKSLDTRRTESKPPLERQRSRSDAPPPPVHVKKKDERLSLRIPGDMPGSMPGGFE